MARFCVRRRFVVLAVWLLVTVALVVVSHRLGDNTNDNLSLPGTDSRRATDALAKSFPDQANGTSPIVLHARSGKLTDPSYASAVDEAAADVAKAAISPPSMLLPILNAIFALLCTLAIIRILGHAIAVPTVAPTLATMIGLGVGIDYALLIVTRHLRGLQDGLTFEEAIAWAAATSGGAVFFAGGTVTIALVSLAVAGIPLVTTMGLMAGVAVVVAVLAALTLLPAGLAITGSRIHSLRVRSPRSEAQAHMGMWARWARWARGVAKQPLLAGLAALAILIPLTIPLLSLTLGQQDVAALSASTTARRAYDLISENFGPGVT